MLSVYIEEVDFVPIGTHVIYVFLIRYSLFDQLRHIICIMFNYVFMHFNVLYCIALLYCIIKANEKKNYMFYHGPINMNLNLNLFY